METIDGPRGEKLVKCPDLGRAGWINVRCCPRCSAAEKLECDNYPGPPEDGPEEPGEDPTA